jgi:hypothetical protein
MFINMKPNLKNYCLFVCLFIYGLFNDTFSSAHYIVSDKNW